MTGLPGHFSPHSFRVAVITDVLDQNVALKVGQDLAGYADPRTIRLHDRRRHKITRNVVQRIWIDADDNTGSTGPASSKFARLNPYRNLGSIAKSRHIARTVRLDTQVAIGTEKSNSFLSRANFRF